MSFNSNPLPLLAHDWLSCLGWRRERNHHERSALAWERLGDPVCGWINGLWQSRAGQGGIVKVLPDAKTITPSVSQLAARRVLADRMSRNFGSCDVVKGSDALAHLRKNRNPYSHDVNVNVEEFVPFMAASRQAP